VLAGSDALTRGDRVRALIILLCTAAVVFALDHLVKALIVGHIALGEEVPRGGLITLHHVENRGAAWGLFPQLQSLYLVVAVLVAGYILLAGHRFGTGAFTQVVLGAILGGAVANAVDRAVQGFVVDYVDLHHWPVFNLADSCIVVGMLVAIMGFRIPGRRGSPA
jgi:signal peptidase II